MSTQSSHPKSVTQLNAFLKKKGFDVSVVNGRGYFYLIDKDGYPIEESSNYVFSVRHFSYESWLEHIEQFINRDPIQTIEGTQTIIIK